MSTPSIGCAGILVEDTFCGPMARLPGGGELLAFEAMPVQVGGCAANVAIDLVRQGLRASVAGCLGDDPAADALMGMLTGAGADVGGVVRVRDMPTSRTVILLVANEDRRYIHVFGANRAFRASQLARSWLRQLDVLYLGGLFAMPGIDLGELGDVLAFCRGEGITTVVDVVVPQTGARMQDLAALLPHIDYFLPNTDEARLFTGAADPLDQLRLLLAAGAHTVVVTQGGAGAVAGRLGRYWRCGAHPDKAVDPSGAGDAFCSGIIRSHIAGWDMPRTLQYASALGFSATRAVGTTAGVFTAAEAEAFAASHPLKITEGSL